MLESIIPVVGRAVSEYPVQMGSHSVHGPIDLPFAFPFYGKEYKQIWISGSGVILFSEPDSLSTLANITSLPRTNGKDTKIGPAFCPLWEGMLAGACEADMAYTIQDSAVGIAWNGVAISGMVYRKNSFQAWIYSTGVMDVFYEDVYIKPISEELSSVNGVVGVIDHTRKRGLTSKLIGNGRIQNTGLRFTPEEADFTDVSTTSSAKLPTPDYTAQAYVTTGDIVERTLYVPGLCVNIDLKIRPLTE